MSRIQLYGSYNDGWYDLQRLIEPFFSIDAEQNLEIDFRDVTWFSADLSAIVETCINRFHSLGRVTIVNIPHRIEVILRKNHFLSRYGYEAMHDINQTTIPLIELEAYDFNRLSNIIDQKLFSLNALPDMSTSLKYVIIQNIAELYKNAFDHGRCTKVFMCGQYYPQRGDLKLTICNTGVTFKDNVSDFWNKDIPATQCISWAMKQNTTTRSDSTGGIGLFVLNRFLRLNGGKISVLSHNGFWTAGPKRFQDYVEDRQTISVSFPGSAIQIEFNTEDRVTYT